eukprot:scaffold3.g6417.t1
MGGMMAPGMLPMAMQRPMGPVPLMAPHVTQMLADAAKGGRSSNVFFKTRICNKWRAGICPYGDKCTYAHGEHELRYVPPELVAQLEAEQKAQEAYHAAQQAAAAQQAGMAKGIGLEGAPDGGSPPVRSYYKTRLCIKFMQTGYCSKGAACTFAHGYEDLRQPDAPLPPHVQQQARGSPGPRPAGAGAERALLASRGLIIGTDGGPRLTPPRGPYQSQRPQSGPGADAASPAGAGAADAASGGDQRRFWGDAGAVVRARALSAIAGVGAAEQHADPSVVRSVVAAARTGAPFQETPYADPVGDLAQPPAAAQQAPALDAAAPLPGEG